MLTELLLHDEADSREHADATVGELALAVAVDLERRLALEEAVRVEVELATADGIEVAREAIGKVALGHLLGRRHLLLGHGLRRRLLDKSLLDDGPLDDRLLGDGCLLGDGLLERRGARRHIDHGHVHSRTLDVGQHLGNIRRRVLGSAERVRDACVPGDRASKRPHSGRQGACGEAIAWRLSVARTVTPANAVDWRERMASMVCERWSCRGFGRDTGSRACHRWHTPYNRSNFAERAFRSGWSFGRYRQVCGRRGNLAFRT